MYKQNGINFKFSLYKFANQNYKANDDQLGTNANSSNCILTTEGFLTSFAKSINTF